MRLDAWCGRLASSKNGKGYGLSLPEGTLAQVGGSGFRMGRQREQPGFLKQRVRRRIAAAAGDDPGRHTVDRLTFVAAAVRGHCHPRGGAGQNSKLGRASCKGL